MENIEKVTWRIWESEGFGRSLLIGGLIFYVPIINLLLLGYFGLWARRLILKKGMDLPEWREGGAIFRELGRVIIPAIVWLFIPFLLAGLLGWAFSGLFVAILYLGIFTAALAWIPMALVALFSPVAMVIALIRLYRSGTIHESLDVPGIIHQVLRNLRRCLFPLFQFYGILAVGWPLIGFASFLATLPLLAHLILLLRHADGDLNSGAI